MMDATTVDAPIEIDLADAVATSSVRRELANQGLQARDTGINIADIFRQEGVLASEAMKNAKAIGDAEARTAGALTAGHMAAAVQTQAFAAGIAGDMTDPGSRKARLVEDHTAAYDEAKSIRDQLISQSKVGFWDNPAQFIMDKLNMPQLVQTHNLLAANANSALEEIHSVDAAVTADAHAVLASTKVLSDSAIADASIVARAAADRLATEYGFKALGSQIDAAKAIKEGNGAYVDSLLKVWNLNKTEEGLRLQKEAAVREQQRFNAWAIDEGNKQKADLEMKRRYVAGMASLHMPLPNDQDFALAMQEYKINPVARARFDAIMEAGTRNLTIGDKAISNSPGSAATVLALTNGNWNDPSEPAARTLVDLGQQIASDGQHKNATKEQMAAEINKKLYGSVGPNGEHLTGFIKTWNTNPEASPIYREPGLQRVADSDFIVKGAAPWYNSVVKGSVDSGTQRISPSDLAKQTVEAVKRGDLSLEEGAVGIAAYYKTAIRINAMNNSPFSLPPQVGYNAEIEKSGILFSAKWDMSNETAVRTMLTQMRNRDAKFIYSQQEEARRIANGQ